MFGRTPPPNRQTPVPVAGRHLVLDAPMVGPWPAGYGVAVFGMGCFWGAEELFWQVPGVYSTAVGYAGGDVPHPTYEQTCTGRTGHAEVVQVVHDPAVVPYEDLLRLFWENHDPTQGDRQGNDIGSQYRSAVFWTTDAQAAAAARTRDRYAPAVRAAGWGEITTEIAPLREFYYAEDSHQQYLSAAKNPHGYRCHAATGVAYPR
ncbi:peptide methionine sulfoxide reductase MsrA [Pilimelia terevasa]|uniref:Peptide methionine sulfoxide reductase MsrA n=1 Tax=Pilimelia terevasa TaxID=53372 RepID=A0A8J3BJ57_9ACTN|nr:peptide-methionine (S)-S-oxide reductase MsrA [Pilimelia terevasa]GGK14846.1 peptide methionine sulfoxide reductase MsrA [Pilimelia terevasa]